MSSCVFFDGPVFRPFVFKVMVLKCLSVVLFVCCVGCRKFCILLTDASCMLAMMVVPLGQGRDKGNTARLADMHMDIGMDVTHGTIRRAQ